MMQTDTSAWQLGYRFSRRPNAVEVPASMLDGYSADDLYDSPPIGSVIKRIYRDGSGVVAVAVSDETGFDWFWVKGYSLWRPVQPTLSQRLADDSPDERGSL